MLKITNCIALTKRYPILRTFSKRFFKFSATLCNLIVSNENRFALCIEVKFEDLNALQSNLMCWCLLLIVGCVSSATTRRTPHIDANVKYQFPIERNQLNPGCGCKVRYPKETPLKLQFRDISFVYNINDSCIIILKFRTERGSMTAKLCA